METSAFLFYLYLSLSLLIQPTCLLLDNEQVRCGGCNHGTLPALQERWKYMCNNIQIFYYMVLSEQKRKYTNRIFHALIYFIFTAMLEISFVRAGALSLVSHSVLCILYTVGTQYIHANFNIKSFYVPVKINK